MKPLLLDTYCKAGGCTKGYQQAGFYVVGVDIEPQKNYCGDEFFQGDALEFIERHGREFTVIHASPPCQAYSRTKSLHKNKHPRLVAPTRAVLKATGKPYVIENVPGSPLQNYVILCGTMFGLRVFRHRLFECDPPIWFAPKACHHWARASGNSALKKEKRVTPNLTDFDILTVTGHDFIVADAKIAMGIDWMTRDELSQAIPPTYTEFIGRRMREMLNL